MVDETNTQVEAPVVEQPPVSDLPASWNGELDHLDKRPWWTKLDDNDKKDLKEGYAKKSSNLESGWNKKYQSLSDEKKAWASKESTYQKELADLRADALFVKEVFGGNSQEAQDVDAKLATLRKEYEDKYGPVEEELKSLREYKTAAERKEAEAHEQLVAKEEKRMAEAYADILKDKGASETFAKLLEVGFDDEEAAEVARTKHKITKPRLPGAAAHASRGDGVMVEDRLPRGKLSSRDLIERAVEQSARRLGVS